MTEEHFIGLAIKEMIRLEVSIHFNRRKNNSKHMANYFSVENRSRPSFVINCFDDELDFQIFLHEYCHFLQWKKQEKIFIDGINSLDVFDDWVEKERPDCDIRHIRNIQLLEIDADRKAIKLIKRHGFDIDITKYIEESNAYVLTYDWMYRNRTWKFPDYYNHPSILKYIKSTPFSLRDLDRDNAHILDLMDEHG